LKNRCLGVASRALENWPGPISPIFKPEKYVSDEQFSFEKPAAQRPPLLKASQTQFCQF
jgi:hypothetical protein